MCFFVLSISNMKYVQSITYKLVGESKKIIKSTPNAYFSFDFPVKFVSKKGIFWENGWFPLVPRKIWVISLKIFKTDPIDNTWLRRNSGEVIFLPQHTSKVNTSELPKIAKIRHGGWKMAHQAAKQLPTRKPKLSRVTSGYGGLMIPLSRVRPTQKNGGYIGVA